jgi:hypothetical protein
VPNVAKPPRDPRDVHENRVGKNEVAMTAQNNVFDADQHKGVNVV